MKYILIIILAVTCVFAEAKPRKVKTRKSQNTTDTVFRDADGNERVWELEEVVIKPKKYSKKGNPAVDLMQRIRKAYSDHDPRKEPYYSYDFYDKILLGLNDFKAPKGKDPFGLRDFIDSIPETGKNVLHLSLKEKAGKDIFRSDPRTSKSIVKGTRSEGVDESFDQQNIKVMLEDVLREVDIFGDNIAILQNRFVSPLSRFSADFYKFFLGDTVPIGDRKYVQLVFTPHNRESMGFNGTIYVDPSDSLLFIKKVEMRIPPTINLNFVNDLILTQEFELDSLGNRHKTEDKAIVELQVIPGTPVFSARRISRYNDFSYDRPEEDLALYFRKEGDEHILASASDATIEEWNGWRGIQSSDAEANLQELVPRLRKNNKWFYWGEKALRLIVTGYVKTGKKSKFDIGPIDSFISTSDLEGLRFRFGGMTTANLSKRLFSRAYIAYGTKDKKFKYSGELEYSFIDKEYHSREFPVHSLRASYTHDMDYIGQHYMFNNRDNLFFSVKRLENDKATYRTLASLDYTLERRNGFSIEAGFKWMRQQPTEFVPFIDGWGRRMNDYKSSRFTVKLRFAPGEKFYQTNSRRLAVNKDAPIFILSHEYGPKGMLGSSYTFNKTEASFQKRFWLSAFGHVDALIRAGKIWSQVYFPELTWANSNLSYIVQTESFALMRPMEFATDQYVSWEMIYNMNGLIFNRIPFLKKAHLREVIGFKGYYGSLSSKNDPAKNPWLLRYPAIANPGKMNHGPYMEASAGIDNIFNILRLEWVWRLTYRDCPGKDRHGLRLALHFAF